MVVADSGWSAQRSGSPAAEGRRVILLLAASSQPILPIEFFETNPLTLDAGFVAVASRDLLPFKHRAFIDNGRHSQVLWRKPEEPAEARGVALKEAKGTKPPKVDAVPKIEILLDPGTDLTHFQPLTRARASPLLGLVSCKEFRKERFGDSESRRLHVEGIQPHAVDGRELIRQMAKADVVKNHRERPEICLDRLDLVKRQ